MNEKMGKNDLAMAEYKKALKFDPLDYKAHTGLGRLYRNRGSFDLAISEFKHALRINPLDLEARAALASAGQDKGFFDLAIKEYKKILLVVPYNASIYYNLGIAYDDKGQLKEAITHYRVKEKFRAHTYISVKLETGRTHQIRVHMAHIHYPLVGDPVYGGRLRIPANATPELEAALRAFRRQALHAARLGFLHPKTQQPVEWQVVMPKDMTQLIEACRQDKELNQ